MNSKTHVLVDHVVLFYHLGMNWEEVWGVLKWVLAALVAGFIGQFGKSLAQFLMKRRRTRKSQPGDSETKIPAPQALSLRVAMTKSDSDAQTKIDKKRAKAKVKRLKKS
jgi:hypothetical protein